MQIYLLIINEVPALIYSKTLKRNRNVLREADCKFTALQNREFCPVTKPWRKKSFHHHRKILTPIFSWTGVNVCPLYKVGTFHTIFPSPRANCLFLQMLWTVTYKPLPKLYYMCSFTSCALHLNRLWVVKEEMWFVLDRPPHRLLTLSFYIYTYGSFKFTASSLLFVIRLPA